MRARTAYNIMDITHNTIAIVALIAGFITTYWLGMQTAMGDIDSWGIISQMFPSFEHPGTLESLVVLFIVLAVITKIVIGDVIDDFKLKHLQ